jgi:formamidopyrimidine-DNA glycosylase
MPERPDLDYVLPILDRELSGRVITAVLVKKPVVLRLAVPGTPVELLVGRRIVGVTRRAHFARFDVDGSAPPSAPPIDLIVAPMLAGRFALAAAGDRAPGDLAVTLALDDGRELRYRDDVQMGKVYVVPRGDHGAIPGFADVGVDVLDPAAFTLDRFRALAKKRRDQAKVFLLDKSALDSFGNAYADEALFEAGIHPKTFVRALGDDDLERLHRAIPEVLGRAARTIAERKPALDEKLRDFLHVRNRHKQPCPRCGTPIRKAGVHGHDAFFCPRCQPETRKASIVSWSKR